MTRRPPLVRVLSLNIVLSILMWVLSDGNFFDRGRKPPSWNAGNRFSSNHYRVGPYSNAECDCNIDKCFQS